MRLKSAFLIVLVFLIVLILAFPYTSFVRNRLSRSFPNLRYETVDASFWGLHLTGVDIQATKDRNLFFDDVRLWPAGIFPPTARLEIKRGAGRIVVDFSGRPSHMNFDAAVSKIDLRECLPALPPEVRLEINGSAKGRVDLKAGRWLEGTHLRMDASGGWAGLFGMALALGKTLQEGTLELELKEQAVVLKTIRVKADSGGFDGTGEIRPAYPIKSATLYLKGQATLGTQTLPIEKSIAIADILSAG